MFSDLSSHSSDKYISNSPQSRHDRVMTLMRKNNTNLHVQTGYVEISGQNQRNEQQQDPAAKTKALFYFGK